MAMTWQNVLGTFMQANESYGSGVSVVAALCSMALWVLFGPMR
jgi:anaerobic glycerol-3-phosphate dehydrogenase